MVEKPESATLDPAAPELSSAGWSSRWEHLSSDESRFIDLIARTRRKSERVARNPGEAP
jgi:hypothetical protein